MKDRNFDDLADRFLTRIYASYKGQLRLDILARDLREVAHLLPLQRPWRILDAGGGAAQYSSTLVQAGHELTICDVSEKMLAQARNRCQTLAPGAKVRFVHAPFQALQDYLSASERFDLILCHAVLEWLADPFESLPKLLQWMAPTGLLSLLFYNRDALVFKNLLHGNLDKVMADQLAGRGRSLTPISPIDGQFEAQWFKHLNYRLITHSGIRCYSDYLDTATRSSLDTQKLVALELALSRRDPYRWLARYVHKIYQPPPQ